MPEFYQTLFGRRDVRSEFTDKAIAEDVLARLLIAAHHAPSVGLSQPWNFIVVRDAAIKMRVHEAFQRANDEAADRFPPERSSKYRQLKLQGILDAPINLCITCDRSRGGEVVLGRTHQADMDIYSTVCAVQNLWLAARAESIGIGWVSIIEPQALVDIFSLPDTVVPIAYLCVGHVAHFRDQPELQDEGWSERLPLESLVFSDSWGVQSQNDALREALRSQANWPRDILKKAGGDV